MRTNQQNESAANTAKNYYNFLHEIYDKSKSGMNCSEFVAHAPVGKVVSVAARELGYFSTNKEGCLMWAKNSAPTEQDGQRLYENVAKRNKWYAVNALLRERSTTGGFPLEVRDALIVKGLLKSRKRGRKIKYVLLGGDEETLRVAENVIGMARPDVRNHRVKRHNSVKIKPVAKQKQRGERLRKQDVPAVADNVIDQDALALLVDKMQNENLRKAACQLLDKIESIAAEAEKEIRNIQSGINSLIQSDRQVSALT